MELHRISIKLYLEPDTSVDLAAIAPIFHAWIRDKRVPGMLIDVADYRHMIDGPGVILIGHDVDYALDMAGGRPGLLYTRKRGVGVDFNEALRAGFAAALTAARTLEHENSLAPPLKFCNDQATLTLLDRLHAPNDKATFERVRGGVEAFAAQFYEGGSISVEHDAVDDRRPLSIHIAAQGAS